MKEDGNVIRLSATDRVQREAVAKQLLTPSHGANNLQLPKQVSLSLHTFIHISTFTSLYSRFHKCTHSTPLPSVNEKL